MLKFSLNGQNYQALNGGTPVGYGTAASIAVECPDQAEVDRLWEALSAGGSIDRCGWLKDRYGVSWQIVPTVLPKMLADRDPTKAQRVMQAMLQMGKLDIAGLEAAHAGRPGDTTTTGELQ